MDIGGLGRHSPSTDYPHRLNLPSYIGFLMPRLEPVAAADGSITDVAITYPMDFEAQMLEYSGRRKHVARQ